ncbi:hypothetical protein DB32_005923 [Sandaracinus amylolyticus]|uniref:Uncharacterized protein n=1 Tax=Sandaracinus amylolyticus TaxID=927083 RepID=A0A0F6SGI9_9BACT|nr:hypothetical protein DB32_005923 [Sandaracinus amylolyticus]
MWAALLVGEAASRRRDPGALAREPDVGPPRGRRAPPPDRRAPKRGRRAPKPGRRSPNRCRRSPKRTRCAVAEGRRAPTGRCRASRTPGVWWPAPRHRARRWHNDDD